MANKTLDANARQMLNWFCRTLPRLTYNSGDDSVSVSAGKGWATAKTAGPRDVEAALRLARSRDIRERARNRRDRRDGVWPYNIDQNGRELS